MATTTASKKKPAVSKTAVANKAKSVAKKVTTSKFTVGKIIGAVAAPIALLAIGYGLTKLDPKTGQKIMGMVFSK